MSDQLVREMGAFSFKFYNNYSSENPGGYHDLYLSDLEAWLRAKGYETARERSITYEHRDRKSDAICLTRGLIDLCARNKDHEVAVEFDNGKRLKFKSIEKLNNSYADILVGVIVGGADDKGVRSNHQRFSEIAGNNSSVNRDVWLIILSERRIELLSVQRNSPYDSKAINSFKANSGIRANAFLGEKEQRKRAIEDY